MNENRFLPLFPLRLIVFPGEKLNLHIFEPRYKQLIHECRDEGITFGINAVIYDNMMPIGTEIKLLSIEKHYPNGEMDICTEGVGSYKIIEFLRKPHNKLYDGGIVANISDNMICEQYDNSEKILELAHEIFGIMNINKKLPDSPSELNTYMIGHYVGMNIEQEYQLLTLTHEKERQDYVLKHLQQTLPVVREMEHLRQRALLNGHFKNIIPPKI